VGFEAPVTRHPTRSTDAGLLLAIAEVLPVLTRGLDPVASGALVKVALRELGCDAAAVVGPDQILAYAGIGGDHHIPGQPYRTLLAGRSLVDGRTVVARGARAVGCAVPNCPLTSGVAAPIKLSGQVAATLVLLRAERRPLSGSVRRGTEAVAQFVGRYLEHLDDLRISPDDLRGSDDSRLAASG